MENIQKDIVDFSEEADSWNIVSSQLEEIIIKQDPSDAGTLMSYISAVDLEIVNFQYLSDACDRMKMYLKKPPPATPPKAGPSTPTSQTTPPKAGPSHNRSYLTQAWTVIIKFCNSMMFNFWNNLLNISMIFK